jgi:hypothetical protein
MLTLLEGSLEGEPLLDVRGSLEQRVAKKDNLIVGSLNHKSANTALKELRLEKKHRVLIKYVSYSHCRASISIRSDLSGYDLTPLKRPRNSTKLCAVPVPGDTLVWLELLAKTFLTGTI